MRFIKHTYLAAALCVAAASPSYASVWIEASDVELRNSLIVLAESGLIETPIQQYPVAWKSVLPQLDALDPSELSNTQKLALQHVRHSLSQAQSGPKTRWYIAATDSENAVLDYGDDTYEEGKISLSRTMHGERWAARVQVNYRQDPFEGDHKKTLDGSYLAYNLNDWSFSVDALPLRWGPAEHSSLLFSNNARPIPKVRVDYAPDYPPAGMAPFKISLFSGYQDDGYSQHYQVHGIRFSSQFLSKLWFGISAIEQREDTISNRMLTADARTGFNWGKHQFSAYAEIGIDKQLESDDKPAYTLGGQWMMGSDSVRHSVTVEYSQLDGGNEHDFYSTNNAGRQYFLSHQRNPGSPFPKGTQTASFSYRQFSNDGSAWTVLVSRSNNDGADSTSRALIRRTQPVWDSLVRLSVQYLDSPVIDQDVGVQLSWEWRF